MVKVGIVGLGRISPWHIDAVLQCEGLELTAICDILPEAIEKAKEKIPHEVQTFASYDDLLKTDVELIGIVTPNHLHEEMTIKAAQAGKHVIVEKPMAMTSESAQRMIDTVKETSTKLFVVKQNRFNKPVKRLLDAVDQNKFGKLFVGTMILNWTRPQEYYDLADWRGTSDKDGGVLYTQAIHHVDLLQRCLGDVESIKAFTAIQNHDITCPDTAIAVLKFKNGALGVIQGTNNTYPKNMEGSVTILGEKGTVKVGGFAVNQIELWKFEGEEEQSVNDLEKDTSNVYGVGHLTLYSNVLKHLNGQSTEHLVDGYEGKKTIDILQAIDESSRTGKEVMLFGRKDSDGDSSHRLTTPTQTTSS